MFLISGTVVATLGGCAPLVTPTPTAPVVVGRPVSVTPTRGVERTWQPTPIPTFTPLPVHTPSSRPGSPGPAGVTPTLRSYSPTPAPAVRIWETTISILTYQYQGAFLPAPTIPYPRLDLARVGPPTPKAYRAVMVENRYLQLTFLPDLGGRLYRCVFKPTGQDVFYRNPVVKPTHWGPDELGWWIAAGGMEWCFPVWEHGYTTALPWRCHTKREKDGGVTFIAEDDEQTTGLHVSVAVTLRPNRADLEIRPTVHNPTGQAQTYKLWLNALLSLSADRQAAPATRFALPVSQAIVHSTGDETLPRPGEHMSWPLHNGRDFSRYADWTSYLGLFAAPPAPPWAGAYQPASDLGLVRVGDMPGVKLFAFGPDQDPATYTDGDSWYFELWSGAAPDFDQALTIAPGAMHTWTERWYPVAGIGGLDGATDRAALRLEAGSQPGTLLVGVAAPARQPGTVVVLVEGAEVFRQTASVTPDRPFFAPVAVPASVPAAGLVTLRFLDDKGPVIAQAERWMAVR